ncbi:MAG: 4-hydroxy-tetrahydrodipicolinate synthase [Prevotellaceae bacterium]|jgi:4-hydroxy-tetrahydrodipicolinate synthase|nr:4-hydroxy-tetrahydrodipicolinate synthase [Prevotellaceae bacterium]
MKTLSGSYVALVTPFNDNLSVNFDKITELVEWHIAEGTDGIVACGTTGEASTLKDDEQLAVIEHVVKVVNKRIPVIAGAGSNETPHSLYLSQEAEKRGADGLLLITPYYNKANDEGLYRHFTTVADKVRIPSILYNVPGRTGMNIPINVLKRLSQHERIVAIKEASGNLDYVLKVAAECPGLAIFSGNDSQVLPILSLGGVGVISVAANVAPKDFAAMCTHYREGRVAESTKLQIKYARLIESLFIEVNPIPVKEALNYLGWGVGGFRAPLYAMSGNARTILITELNNMGIKGRA